MRYLIVIAFLFLNACGSHSEKEMSEKIVSRFLSSKTTFLEKSKLLSEVALVEMEKKYKAFISLSGQYDKNFSLNKKEQESILKLKGDDFFRQLDKVEELKTYFSEEWKVTLTLLKPPLIAEVEAKKGELRAVFKLVRKNPKEPFKIELVRDKMN